MKPYSAYFDRIKVRPDPQAAAKAHAPGCQWDGCNEAATHKAPVGRMKEGEYFRFCVDHVRQYNKGYNYFSGLSDTEIARYQKEAVTGHRPTWTMGANASAGSTRSAPDVAGQRSGRAGYYNRLKDPFNLFQTGGPNAQPRERKLKTLEAKALETLGLDGKATAPAIKARYKELVKLHHPDANGGARESEDRFRDVIQAYRLLKQAGFC